MRDEEVVLKPLVDVSEGDSKAKAKELWRRQDWDAEQAVPGAAKASAKARYAAQTAETASEAVVLRIQSARLSKPPGLVNELATVGASSLSQCIIRSIATNCLFISSGGEFASCRHAPSECSRCRYNDS